MVYVLEWRDPPGDIRRTHCLVSYVRVFQSAATIKGFVRSRRFAAWSSSEVRLTLRGRDRAAPVITSVAAILAWNPAEAPLPLPLPGSRWQADSAMLGLAVHVLAAVAAELERARAAGLLSAADVQMLVDGLREALHKP